MPQIHIFIALMTAVFVESVQTSDKPPNIVFIFPDDMGWNDIGFHNPDIVTPNLDKLAHEGIILNHSYAQPVCSPSRAALMTGVYPYRIGLQHLVIMPSQPVCIPLKYPVLPEVLQTNGYSTHMIGKWHLGFCDWKCAPTGRGFDSFLGFLTLEEDYVTKQVMGGYDFRNNKTVEKDADKTHSTFLYRERIREIISEHDTESPLFLYLAHQLPHAPLEIPDNYSHLYPDIHDKTRRIYSTMVTMLDDTVGDVVNSLKVKGIYDNTLIVFVTDNGGMVYDGGNNYPLRGQKLTIFEGGTRVPSFVHGPMFTKTGGRYDGLIHLVDWFPTLVEAAGIQYESSDMDGVSQWQSLLTLNSTSARNEVLYNLDLSSSPMQGRAAIRIGDWKYIEGYPGLFPDWYKPPTQTTGERFEKTRSCLGDLTSNNTTRHRVCDYQEMADQLFKNAEPNSSSDLYLFNLKEDPNEHTNLYEKEPDIVKQLSERLEWHKGRYVEPLDPPSDPASDPSKWGGNWTPGWCTMDD